MQSFPFFSVTDWLAKRLHRAIPNGELAEFLPSFNKLPRSLALFATYLDICLFYFFLVGQFGVPFYSFQKSEIVPV